MSSIILTTSEPCVAHADHEPEPTYCELHHVIPQAWQRFGIHTVALTLENTSEVAWIDEDDFVRVQGFRWTADHGYVRSTDRGAVYLHRLLMETPDDLVVDHRNGNGLDNRRSNLRNVTHAVNIRAARSAHGASEHNGVSWDEQTKRWRASVTINGKFLHLGRYSTEEDAAQASDRMRAILLPDEQAQVAPLFDPRTVALCRTGHGNVHHWLVQAMKEYETAPGEDGSDARINAAWVTVKRQAAASHIRWGRADVTIAKQAMTRFRDAGGSLLALCEAGLYGDI